MVSSKLDIPLLPQSTLLHLRAEGVELRVGGGCRILEDVRHRSPAERVDDAVDHRSHRLAIRPTLLQPVKDLLFTRLPDCNQVLVDQPVQGRRYTRVRNLSRFEDLVVNCPRRRGAEIPNGPEDREFQLSKFHADYYMHSNLIRTCRWLDSSLGESRSLGRGFRESLREDVQRRDEGGLAAAGSVPLELHHDPRGIVAGLHRLDLV